MAESKLYLNFLKQNLRLLIVPALLGISFAVWYQRASTPTTYSVNRLFESSFDESVDKKLILIDQAVSTVRSNQVISSLVNQDVKTRVFKSAPLTLSLEITGRDGNGLGEPLEQVSRYIISKYPLEKVGQDIELVDHPDFFMPSLVGGLFGFVAGAIISLIKTYLQRY